MMVLLWFNDGFPSGLPWLLGFDSDSMGFNGLGLMMVQVYHGFTMVLLWFKDGLRLNLWLIYGVILV